MEIETHAPKAYDRRRLVAALRREAASKDAKILFQSRRTPQVAPSISHNQKFPTYTYAHDTVPGLRLGSCHATKSSRTSNSSISLTFLKPVLPLSELSEEVSCPVAESGPKDS